MTTVIMIAKTFIDWVSFQSSEWASELPCVNKFVGEWWSSYTMFLCVHFLRADLKGNTSPRWWPYPVQQNKVSVFLLAVVIIEVVGPRQPGSGALSLPVQNVRRNKPMWEAGRKWIMDVGAEGYNTAVAVVMVVYWVRLTQHYQVMNTTSQK